MARRVITPAQVLGSPIVPPAGAVVAVNRVRATLGRLRDALAPPPLRVMDAALSWLDLAAIHALCVAGVPDVLDRPMRTQDLARKLSADHDSLDRLLRFVAARGWVRFDRAGRVGPTRALRFLSAGHPGGWRAWIEFAASPEVAAAASALPRALADGSDPFAIANGSSFFTWMANHPGSAATFDGAMAAGARLHGLGLASVIDWTTMETVCDVGGGTGELLATLVSRQPHLRGTVLELPHVVDRTQASDRVAFVAGDAFAEVPSGFDCYLLVNVVHDWSDVDVVRLLEHVAIAARDGSRVVIVEGERRSRPVDDLQARSDLLMLALAPGGRERTRSEIDVLAARAGLRPVRAAALPSADVALVYAVTDDANRDPGRPTR